MLVDLFKGHIREKGLKNAKIAGDQTFGQGDLKLRTKFKNLSLVLFEEQVSEGDCNSDIKVT